jgi:hypothetical protein
MSYEFEINDFKEDILNILGGDEEWKKQNI